jgi:uncharacterized protein with HEPN domain
MTIVSGAMLGILQEAGNSILIMTEGLEYDEFFSSRITQHEVLRQLQIMADTTFNLPYELKQKMLEIDWEAWSALSMQFTKKDESMQEAVWFAVRSLVPATLLWLRVFHKSAPEIFAFVA